ncbi:hypothetical protein PPGU16_84750 (plasmid) [Paraburkholderia largidicola]|uniref:Uncharacterized protein n=2 Tax=Paraburkholderia largidicola TaxID=3014751 RepID=A0A7I8C5D6_9BURK|nr:hypothetical protein PPGU16_84750 [Paraburkholderia sp. PGU16]
MGLTTRELSAVDETLQGRYVVWIREDPHGFWKVEIHVDDGDRVYDLDTTRGGTKSWRQLKDALLFVKENCPRAKDVFLEVEQGWVLQKTPDDLTK